MFPSSLNQNITKDLFYCILDLDSDEESFSDFLNGFHNNWEKPEINVKGN